MSTSIAAWGAAAVTAAWLAPLVTARLRLSRAKHRSLSGHSRLSKRAARVLPFYEFNEGEFFGVDGAPAEVVKRRREGFHALSEEYNRRFAETARETANITEALSDLQFTGRYRVPFQFSRYARKHFKAGSMLSTAEGVTVTDLDGNRLYDLSGSYGVNLFGIDFYKDCIARGAEHVRELGPVLGPLHPLVAYNVKRLQSISGLEQISFHMSGTEAIMQAVRLARYHTGRKKLVRFCGAYHGWWGEVQPGVGNPVNERDTYTLADLSERSLRVLATRRDIACVLVNPLQALHPNTVAPSDSTLIDSSRRAQFARTVYTEWLQQLREICTRRGIVLIFDEVFVGFRIALAGAQEYFGITADMVTYGKTLGGGLPVGVLCGRADLMKRYREDYPADVCFARGTFNSHPYVMGAMYEFLRRLESPEIRSTYDGLDELWNGRADTLNSRLRKANMPIRVANLSSIWTLLYTQPSRYNWMFQFYLRSAGLALSWVGTGRFIFSHNYGNHDFTAVCDRMLQAAENMKKDGWWWQDARLSNKTIKHRILREMLAHWR